MRGSSHCTLPPGHSRWVLSSDRGVCRVKVVSVHLEGVPKLCYAVSVFSLTHSKHGVRVTGGCQGCSLVSEGGLQLLGNFGESVKFGGDVRVFWVVSKR